MGGPYASEEDARRAIERGGFSESAANLAIVGDGEDDDDDGEDKQKEARKTAAFPPESTPSTNGDAGPGNPSVPDVTEQDQPDEVTDPGAGQGTLDSDSDLDFSGGEAGGMADAGPPMFPITTKPSQLPSGGQTMLPGGSSLPPMPGSPQFAPGGMQSPDVTGTDPIAGQIDTMASLVLADNPGLPEEEARRVARQVVGRYLAVFDPYSMMPSIEDPLANRSPFELGRVIKPGTPAQQPQQQDGQQDDQRDTFGESSQSDEQDTFGEGPPNRTPPSGARSGPGNLMGGSAQMVRLLPRLLV